MLIAVKSKEIKEFAIFDKTDSDAILIAGDVPRGYYDGLETSITQRIRKMDVNQIPLFGQPPQSEAIDYIEITGSMSNRSNKTFQTTIEVSSLGRNREEYY